MQELYMRSQRRLATGGQEITPWLGIIRIGIGLVQGLLLYGLWHANEIKASWTIEQPALFAGLTLAVLYGPLVGLASLGRLRTVPLLIWSASAALVLAAIGAANHGYETAAPYLPWPLLLGSAAATFIAHHLVVPAIEQGKFVAPYPAYFHTAWKAGVQFVLSLMFVGAFWLILHLGAALFAAVGLDGLRNLIRDEIFFIPVSFTVFAIAVHLSDVRDGLIQGIRTVALMLLSWLLPLALVLAGAFLVTLPFTGLGALKASFSPAGLMLSSAAGLIILGNTVYQDGAENLSPVPFLRLCLKVVGVLLVPLIGIAIWAVMARIGQYGLTPTRMVGLTCALIGIIYAIGYLASTFLPRIQGRSAAFEVTNVVAGVAAVLALLVHTSPWFNPARMSVDNQIGRLHAAKVTNEQFDYGLLRFKSGEYGRKALAELARSKDAQVARSAKEFLGRQNRYDTAPPRAASASLITFMPEGTQAPEGFMEAVAEGGQPLPCPGDGGCTARLIDVNADGTDEVLLIGPYLVRVWSITDQGAWNDVGAYTARNVCGQAEKNPDVLMAAEPKTRPHDTPLPLEIAGSVYDFAPQPRCND